MNLVFVMPYKSLVIYSVKAFLVEQIKIMIRDSLDVDDLDIASIDEEAPLLGGALELDSIDALELVIQVEKRYGVKIKSSEETRRALSSVSVLADYILEHAPDKVAEEHVKVEV
jgi:acyl carrier protein